MYKRPSKRAQLTRLSILYGFMTLVVAVTVTLFILVVSNYTYNRESGTIEQRGLVQLASVPSGASVTIDGQALSSRTSTKKSISAGAHSVLVNRPGYEWWSRDIAVTNGELLWLDYIRLVPKERPIEQLLKYDNIAASTVSPNKGSIILQTGALEPSWQLVDITGDQPKDKLIDLPSDVTKSIESGSAKKPSYRFGDWDKRNERVLLWQTYGKKRELIIFDTKNPDKSINISREFRLPITQAYFSKRSDDTVYLLAKGMVRRLSLNDVVISRSLLSEVKNFTLHADDEVLYESLPDKETGFRQVGVVKSGSKTPSILRTVQNEKTKVALATAAYFSRNFIAIADGGRLEVYTGRLAEDFEGMQLVASRTFDEPIQSIEFNEAEDQLLVRLKHSFISYKIDRNLFSSLTKLDDATAKDLFWIDSMHLGLIDDETLTMRDIDGSNIYDLGPAQAGQVVSLSRKGTYLYSIGRAAASDAPDKAQLQRIRMILP